MNLEHERRFTEAEARGKSNATGVWQWETVEV